MGEQSPRGCAQGHGDVIFAGTRTPPVACERSSAFDNSAGDAQRPSGGTTDPVGAALPLRRVGECQQGAGAAGDVPTLPDTGSGTRGYTIVDKGDRRDRVRQAETPCASRRPPDQQVQGAPPGGERKLEDTDNSGEGNDVLGDPPPLSSIERQAKKAAATGAARHPALLGCRSQPTSAARCWARRGGAPEHAGPRAPGRRRETDGRVRAVSSEERGGEEGERARRREREALSRCDRASGARSRIDYERAERRDGRGQTCAQREREEMVASAPRRDEEAARLADELGGIGPPSPTRRAPGRGEGEARAAPRRSASANATASGRRRWSGADPRGQHRGPPRCLRDRLAESDPRLRSTEEQLEVQGSEDAQWSARGRRGGPA